MPLHSPSSVEALAAAEKPLQDKVADLDFGLAAARLEALAQQRTIDELRKRRRQLG